MEVYKNAIKNRYEMMFFVQCKNGNPNGDPDLGNMPRVDPETMTGYITDVSIKRAIRDYIATAHSGEDGMNIIMERSTNLNRRIAEAKEAAGVDAFDTKKAAVIAGQRKACDMFYDVRTFGAVLSTGPNAGQIRGPVQISFGRSVSPVSPQNIAITRVAVAETVNGAQSSADYMKDENEKDESSLRTMGRKQFIPFGLYVVHVFVSANLAEETGFSDDDFTALQDAILGMYDQNHSASKGELSVVGPLVIFKHIGTAPDDAGRARQVKLGCASAQRLFECIQIREKEGISVPRDYRDYDVFVDFHALSNIHGVDIGFKPYAGADIAWTTLPDSEDWFSEIR